MKALVVLHMQDGFEEPEKADKQRKACYDGSERRAMERPKKTETGGLFGARPPLRKEGMFSGKMKERKLAMTVEREARIEAFSRQELVEAVQISFLNDRDGTVQWSRRVLSSGRDVDEMLALGLLRQSMERSHGLDPTESWRVFREVPHELLVDATLAVIADRKVVGERAEHLYRTSLTGGGFNDFQR